MLTRSVLLLSSALVLLGAGGCGAGSDEEQIQSVTSDFVSALRDENWKKACDQFSEKAVTQLEVAGAFFNSKDCPDTMKKVAAIGGDELDDITGEATNIKVAGDKATARSGKETTHYVKEDGKWKIDADPEDESSDDSSSSTSSSGETETPTPAPAPEVAVEEQGFTNTDSGATYGLVLKNTDVDTDARGVEVKLNFLGGDGDVLETDSKDIVGVPAGEEFVIGGDVDTSGDKVEQLEITATAEAGAPVGTVRLPEATKPKLTGDEYFFKVRIQLENTLAEPLSSISDVFAIVRSSGGEIIGGISGFPENELDAGDRAAVELTSFTEFTGDVKVEASADGETTG